MRKMKAMKIRKMTVMFCLIAACFPMFFTASVNADTQMANQYLQRAINELQAAKVYIQQAKQQAPKNQRIVFHYDGVISDINKIESGIQEKFNTPRIQPRVIKAVKGDYTTVVGKDQ